MLLRLRTIVLLALCFGLTASASFGASMAAAQTIAVNVSLEHDEQPAARRAVLLPAPARRETLSPASAIELRESASQPSFTTAVLAFAVSAFWLTLVAHVLGAPRPPARRRP